MMCRILGQIPPPKPSLDAQTSSSATSNSRRRSVRLHHLFFICYSLFVCCSCYSQSQLELLSTVSFAHHPSLLLSIIHILELYVMAKRYNQAVEMCLDHKVPLPCPALPSSLPAPPPFLPALLPSCLPSCSPLSTSSCPPSPSSCLPSVFWMYRLHSNQCYIVYATRWSSMTTW